MVLTSVEAVIEAIGLETVRRLAGVGPSAVSNWKARGKIPCSLFLVISEELEKSETTVDPKIFGLRVAK